MKKWIVKDITIKTSIAVEAPDEETAIETIFNMHDKGEDVWNRFDDEAEAELLDEPELDGDEILVYRGTVSYGDTLPRGPRGGLRVKVWFNKDHYAPDLYVWHNNDDAYLSDDDAFNRGLMVILLPIFDEKFPDRDLVGESFRLGGMRLDRAEMGMQTEHIAVYESLLGSVVDMGDVAEAFGAIDLGKTKGYENE